MRKICECRLVVVKKFGRGKKLLNPQPFLAAKYLLIYESVAVLQLGEEGQDNLAWSSGTASKDQQAKNHCPLWNEACKFFSFYKELIFTQLINAPIFSSWEFYSIQKFIIITGTVHEAKKYCVQTFFSNWVASSEFKLMNSNYIFNI